jgi:hypothetical protein
MSSSAARPRLLMVADAFSQELFLDRFGDPAIAGDVAGATSARIIDRLEHLGGEPKIEAIERTRRSGFSGVIHRRHYGAILA